ncbi:hypothetical protein BDB00DRAFT_822017 [Zychaea mexicana]|uniref:uncharacterized protein n=1 Tax=Zychaea mexicana TaxID=64656 RepID=UPI0022FE11C5|nr:uncharacterized protein BDB00DRAFT_822017 [Zychaea mexicana]KAI9493657.1 hypothetical protein BDB00DRAFT_822017 [Zychaea mexicana]
MMCCNRCGDILSSGKCRKCGGRPVASIIASSGMNSPTIGKEASVKIADKWQSQYASGILGSPHTVFDTKEHQEPLTVQSTVSTPLRSSPKRNSIPDALLLSGSTRKQNPLSLSLQNSCAHCSKRLRYDMPSFLESGSYYCKECHVALFSKGPCAKCKNPVFHQRDTFVEHETQVWHKDCFRCHNCFITLGDAPMVDLEARPCCERCLIAQSGEARHAKLSYPTTSSGAGGDTTAASTPGLATSPLRDTISSAGSAAFWLPRTPPPASSSRPRIDSVLFNHYQKSLQDEQQQVARNASASPPLPPLTPSSMSPAGSIRSSPSASPVSAASISPSPSPLSSSSSSSSSTNGGDSPVMTITSPSTNGRPRRLSQQLQQQLSKSLSQERGNKRMSTTSTKRTCLGCGEALLHGSKIKLPSLDGDDAWYHYDCLKCAGCRGHFTDSKFVRHGSHAIYHPKCQPAPSRTSEDEKQQQRRHYECYACKQSIKEKCYENGSRTYHPQCFRCYQCHVVLPSDQPFYEAYNEPHCEACISNRRPPSSQTASRPLSRNRPSGSSTSTPLLSSQRSLDHPSSVLMNRTRALPKLGGSKTCPRCHTSIAIMDDTLGPKATRWHKKCLRCAGCSKQMDSGARMSEDADGKWLVHCRACMDKTGSKTKFVR